MIVDIEILVNIVPSNLNHFKNLGYENLKIGKKIIIPIEHLNKGSNLPMNYHYTLV